MSTIPLYLYAAYSIRGEPSDAKRMITSVVVEEMLHLALTTNLLLALGGEPDFGDELMPRYPSVLAHHKPDLSLDLKRCTPQLITETFMVIERPESPDAPPEADEFETLGQFYAALERAIHELSEHVDLFADHQPDRQLSEVSFYGPVAFDAADSGGLVLIHDVPSACRALEIIVDQGEGLADHRWADPDHQELTHYYKFAQLADEAAIGATWPVMDNPRVADLPETTRPVAELFNAVYRLLFSTMEQLFAPGVDQEALVGRLYGLMSGGMRPIASYLVSLPGTGGRNAGPTFERYAFGSSPAAETRRLVEEVVRAHPMLAPIQSTLESVLAD